MIECISAVVAFTPAGSRPPISLFCQRKANLNILQGKDDFLRQFQTYNHVRLSLCCLVKLTDAGAAANTQVVH